MSLFNLERFVPEELSSQGPPCPTAPQNCGPPKVKIFGGNGIGAIANAIISPNSNSVIGFDIVDPGRGFFDPPYVELVDDCGKGRGGLGIAVIGPLDGTNGNPSVVNPITGEPEIGVIDIIVDSPGNGYIARPDGSLGGDERVWAEADEGTDKGIRKSVGKVSGGRSWRAGCSADRARSCSGSVGEGAQ